MERKGGSPPRMRGKACGNVCDRHRHGITPAYAGKSKVDLPDMCTKRDHPRVCGEKTISLDMHRTFSGSPPRMRGKVPFYLEFFDNTGITPAYAGKRPPHRRKKPVHEDHPRVCGEKHIYMFPVPLVLGSPPRMRGKGVHHVHDSPEIGITPAYAGKSMGRRRLYGLS